MPKLLVFAPCEKVINSSDDNNPTLVSILTEVGGEFQSDQPIEKTSVAPHPWSIFTMWAQQPGEEGKEFLQTVRLVSPSNEVRISVDRAFTMSSRIYRSTGKVGILPIGESGEWRLQVFVRAKGEEIPTEPVAEYPLLLRMIHRTKVSSESTPGTPSQ